MGFPLQVVDQLLIVYIINATFLSLGFNGQKASISNTDPFIQNNYFIQYEKFLEQCLNCNSVIGQPKLHVKNLQELQREVSATKYNYG